MGIMELIQRYGPDLLIQFLEHLQIIGISVVASIVISVPLGFFASTRPKLSRVILYIASILMTVPSLALFGIMVVVFAPVGLGLGMVPAVIAIIIYSILPITRNTITALNQVSSSMIEAAKGIGLTNRQILWKVKLPLSIPVIMAGIRNATVLGVGVATYAALVAAGGLGNAIFNGIRRSDLIMVLLGTIAVSILGIGVNFLLMKLEVMITPKGLRVNK
jgi:osmoprotectant transport system permease protein